MAKRNTQAEDQAAKDQAAAAEAQDAAVEDNAVNTDDAPVEDAPAQEADPDAVQSARGDDPDGQRAALGTDAGFIGERVDPRPLTDYSQESDPMTSPGVIEAAEARAERAGIDLAASTAGRPEPADEPVEDKPAE